MAGHLLKKIWIIATYDRGLRSETSWEGCQVENQGKSSAPFLRTFIFKEKTPVFTISQTFIFAFHI